MSLTIDMLPAREGDALWIEYGEPTRRILYDAGVGGTWEAALRARLEALPADDRHFELLVISHIDADHIAGSLPLLEHAAELGVTFGDIWFNGYRHLVPAEVEPMGPVDGEKLTRLIVQGGHPWNQSFGGDAVVVPDGDDQLPTVELGGGLKLTLVSPTPLQLRNLEPVWRPEVEKAGLVEGVPGTEVEVPEGAEALGVMPDVDALAASRFQADDAEANGSSIAVLLEHDGRSAILAADAFPSVIEESLKRIPSVKAGEKLKLNAFKLPHHGSRRNINLGLLEMIDTPLYLFSTKGTKTHHPNPEAVARTLSTAGENPTLAFNYLSEYNEPWREPDTIERYEYTVAAPETDAEEGLRVPIP